MFNKYLFNNDHVPGTIPSALDTVAKKKTKVHVGVYILIWDIIMNE